MPCGPVDGMNPVKVAEAMDEAIDRARRGDGPTFLEIKNIPLQRPFDVGCTACTVRKKKLKNTEKIDPITQVLDIIKENKYAYCTNKLKRLTKE
jgi:pyruvate dehydrogenase E1 component alpha subunit